GFDTSKTESRPSGVFTAKSRVPSGDRQIGRVCCDSKFTYVEDCARSAGPVAAYHSAHATQARNMPGSAGQKDARRFMFFGGPEAARSAPCFSTKFETCHRRGLAQFPSLARAETPTMSLAEIKAELPNLTPGERAALARELQNFK